MTSPAHWKKEQPGKPITIGYRKGTIEVIAQLASLGTGHRYRVRCDCGGERVLPAAAIRRGKFTSHQWCAEQRGD